MTFFFLLLISISCFSCEQKKDKEQEKQIQKQEASVDTVFIPSYSNTSVQEIYTDTLEFLERIDKENYELFLFKKDSKIRTLINYHSTISDTFLRGDLLEVQWKNKIPNINSKQEKEQLRELLIAVKKNQEGAVSLFRKKHKEPLTYWWDPEASYSRDFLNELYATVEYYLANSKNKRLQTYVNNTDSQLGYSIEQADREGKTYIVLGIFTRFENHENKLQWLYLDTETKMLYEYDLPNDRLMKFE